MSKQSDKEKFINTLRFVIKRNTDRTYNIQAVAKMLGLPNDLEYVPQCRVIMDYLHSNSRTNDIIKELLDTIGERDDICNILVNTLYNLFHPSSFPNKAPIKITEDLYRSLITQKSSNTISEEDDIKLTEALNCKYCHCVKKLYLENS